MDFYTRWNAKALQLGNDSTENCIDKYVSQFVVYNFLYCLIPEFESRQNGPQLRFSHDNTAATENVVIFFGETNLSNLLQQNSAQVTELHTILDQKLFSICFNWQRVYQAQQDQQLANDLISTNEKKKGNCYS